MLARSLFAVVAPVALVLATNADALPYQFRRYEASHHVIAVYHARANSLAHPAAPSHIFAGSEAQVVAHPVGCPRTLFCGCGAGRTRIHRISLAGLVVVDPHAGHHGQPTFASFSPIAREPSSPGRGPDNPVEPKVAAYNSVVTRFGSRAHSVIPSSPDSCSVAHLYRPLAISTTAASMVEKRL